jgi:serine/threonine protein kinase, bacterial
VGVLGPFIVERDGDAVDTGSWQRRVSVLFKLLATARDRQRLRDDLIDMLWPDADPDGAAGNLRMLVHRLRMAVGETGQSTVLSEHGWISLNPLYVWELDLDQLESVAADPMASRPDMEGAVALYRGEPLAEDRYEDWAAPLRDRAHRAWRATNLRLASEYETAGALDEAERCLQTVLDADQLDEEVLRRLLETSRNARRPADALRRYAVFEHTLREELDVPPSAETMEVVEAIRCEADQLGQSGVLNVPTSRGQRRLPVGSYLGALPEEALVDREDELERVELLLKSLEAGHGRTVLLVGEPGVGKTRLAQEISARLIARGFLIAAGHCYGSMKAVPFHPVVGILGTVYTAAPEHLRAQVAERWPDLTALLPRVARPPGSDHELPEEQRQVFHAVAGFLAAIAEEIPVAILMDDIQWADEGTLDLLLHLARETVGARVLLLAAYRWTEISSRHPLNDFTVAAARDTLVERIAVNPLTHDATARLVAMHVGESAPEFLEFVYRRTRGNPHFIKKLLQALGGRYSIIREVGAGGMGRVFEAIDRSTGSQVAIKVMFARTELDPAALLRFQQEAAMLARLEHPNIVKVHGAFSDEHTSCIVMELLPGRSLGQILGAESLTLARIRGLAVQITAALTCAHEQGIIHRDVKPDNVMVGDDDHVTVMDFGVARLMRPAGGAATLTSTGMTVGTPLYMAPEQIQARKADARSDIYSLGALLYHLVTGRPPFDGDDPLSVALRHVHEPVIPPSSLQGSLPAGWDELILKALAKSPADRFQSAVALERGLNDLAVDTTPLTRKSPSTSPRSTEGGESEVDGEEPQVGRSGAVPRPNRQRWAAALGGALVIAVLVTVGVMAVPRLIGAGKASLPSATPPPSGTPHGSGPGQFEGPSGIGVDSRGNVYVADTGNNRVQQLSPDGIPLNSWGKLGNSNGQFTDPSNLVVTHHGAIWVEDFGNQRIAKLTIDGRPLDEIDVLRGSVAVDPADDLFVYLPYQRRILEYSWNRDQLASWSLPDIGSVASPFPAGIAVDVHGAIYVCDRKNNHILKLVPRDSRLVLVRTFGARPADYQFNQPSGVAVDTHGTVYVADTRSNRIVKLAQTGKAASEWGEPGIQLGQFDQPSSLAIDDRGNIYVTDYFNDRVQKLSPTGRPIWATSGARPLHS